jgi:hypothetical protein
MPIEQIDQKKGEPGWLPAPENQRATTWAGVFSLYGNLTVVRFPSTVVAIDAGSGGCGD